MLALGGSGTYTARGSTYDFTLSNTGTVAWQYFSLAAPAGSVFVGGTTSNEGSARCVVGPSATITCGPIGVVPSARIEFTGVLQAPLVPCGVPLAFSASADGTTFTRVDDAVFVGSCAPPHLVRGVRVRRRGAVVTAGAPEWSVPPVRVVYTWQRCLRSVCTRLATGLRVRTRSVVRVVVVATFADGSVLRSVSARV